MALFLEQQGDEVLDVVHTLGNFLLAYLRLAPLA
jgi:hypothetical protein